MKPLPLKMEPFVMDSEPATTRSWRVLSQVRVLGLWSMLKFRKVAEPPTATRPAVDVFWRLEFVKMNSR